MCLLLAVCVASSTLTFSYFEHDTKLNFAVLMLSRALNLFGAYLFSFTKFYQPFCLCLTLTLSLRHLEVYRTHLLPS